MKGFRALGLAARSFPARTGASTPWITGVNQGRICRNGDASGIFFRLNSTAATATREHPPSTTPTTTNSTPPTSPTPVTADQFRAVMRELPHSVVVCTSIPSTNTPEEALDRRNFRGMTMSSFTSLSLDPIPLVSFNIKKPSRTLDAIRESGRFNIHILRADAHGVKVAEWFSTSNASFNPFERIQSSGCEVYPHRTGAILWGEGVRTVLSCKVEKLLGVRDHEIVVGEVEQVLGGGEFEALAYAQRQYRPVGPPIQRHRTS
ncbi:hypothetical protein jhhlp_002795 [Lomentospora prolificans]|uniref:Flavin reductase like domain-containing protein n=1 Tax=Lomentospora prolificans TaxID=41688 RepID=A0A2N3NF33_9PEZI|nr:hypothetical protein jhhlp_002795 [Lomentospora prolificans]